MRKKPNYLKREQRNLPIAGYKTVEEENFVIKDGVLVKKEHKEPIFSNKRTMRRNLANVINSLGIENAMSNSEFYLQPRINTALNKQVFINYIAEQLKDSDLKIFFDAYSDNITITDKKTNVKEINKFYKMISGDDFKIGINLHSPASNYSIKEKFIQNETIKEKLRESGIYDCYLIDVVKKMYDTDITCKVDYAYLFNTSIYNERDEKDIKKIVDINITQKSEEQIETLQLHLISEAYNKLFVRGTGRNKEKNQFGVLDMISKLSGTSLNVCYERHYGKFTEATNNYLDLEFADPILVVKNDKDGSVLYKGEDVLIAVQKTLDHFTNTYKFNEKDKSLTGTLNKIFDSCYAQQQLIYLEDYMLTFEASTNEGDEALKTFETSINNAIQILQNYNYEIIENLSDETIPYTKGILKDYPEGITRLDIAYNLLDELDARTAWLELDAKHKQSLIHNEMPSSMIEREDEEALEKFYKEKYDKFYDNKYSNSRTKSQYEQLDLFDFAAIKEAADVQFKEYEKKDETKRELYKENIDEQAL